MHTRVRPAGVGWLVVLCHCEEQQHLGDPRIRILLDERRASPSMTLEDPGPIIVVERDDVVRHLLVSQIERLGALCYPSDDFQNAIRLLAAEPRAQTVMIDCALAASEMADWIEQICAVRPDASIIATGTIGAESDLLAQGVSTILRKPWRIQDLLAAIDS